MADNVVGPQVRKFRDQHGWSQEVLAARLQRQGWDISRGTLAKIEAQVRCVNDSELAALANALEVQIPILYPPSAQKVGRGGRKSPAGPAS